MKFGLSLCIQGTYNPNGQDSLYRRFIPVYTGNIFRIFLLTAETPVYPCVYREHTVMLLDNVFTAGLSLCIQGTSPADLTVIERPRFIPVYTGNIPIITYCFIIKILAVKFLPIFWDIFHQNHNI